MFIPCKICGDAFSANARVCSHCGEPNFRGRMTFSILRKYSWAGFFLISVAAFAMEPPSISQSEDCVLPEENVKVIIIALDVKGEKIPFHLSCCADDKITIYEHIEPLFSFAVRQNPDGSLSGLYVDLNQVTEGFLVPGEMGVYTYHVQKTYDAKLFLRGKGKGERGKGKGERGKVIDEMNGVGVLF